MVFGQYHLLPSLLSTVDSRQDRTLLFTLRENARTKFRRPVMIKTTFGPGGYRCVLLLFAMMGTLGPRARAQACGANAQSPIATDRPQITSSSIVVPCGSLQFENGFQETSNGGQRTYDLPETSIRFGIAGKTELRYMVPDYYWNFATGSGGASGLGDMSLS